MIHIKIFINTNPPTQIFRCGIVELPVGDTYYFDGDPDAWRKADCPVCNPDLERPWRQGRDQP